MKIGIITVNDKPTNALASGGTEVFVSAFATELKKRGHEVILFASGDSDVEDISIVKSTETALDKIQGKIEKEKGDYISFIDREFISNMLSLRNVVEAKKIEKKVDVFHENTGSPIVGAVLDLLDKPVVSTLHMPITDILKHSQTSQYVQHKNTHYITISEYQKEQLPFQSKRIYNGISMEPYEKCDCSNSDKIIWIGRIDPSTPKGLDDAIKAATACDHSLEYVGFVESGSYFDEKIKPLLNDKVNRREQFTSISEKAAFYKSAKVSLIPIQWEEPFGLTFIESMAAGTPIITYARGAAPELIKDGITGFIVNASDEDIRGNWIIKKTGIEGLQEAITRIYLMEENAYNVMRKNCIEHVKNHFTLAHMVDEYVHYFEELISK